MGKFCVEAQEARAKMTCLDVMTVCPGDPVFPQVRPRQWETLHTYIHTYDKLPKIVDRSFIPVVGN